MKQTIQNFKHKDFYDSAVALFEKLSIPLNKPTREPIDLSLLGEHKSLEHIEKAYLIGQVDDAIFQGKSLHVSLKEGKYEGPLLFGVALKKQNPTRAELASISRTFNRAFKYLPVVILFYYGDKLSLSSTERLEYKISKEGEKVGKVSILRDISIQNPHAGHIKVLQALVRNTKTKTYDELYNHWQKTLNISIVTKEFYAKLFTLFTELQNSITYPNESQKEFFIITLLGRILFLRFLHAKGLIPDEKFEVKEGYYHEVLELLFFEVLNKPLEKRRVTCKEPNIPFLNGGLFEESKNDHYKFSDLAQISENLGILKIPDAWFVSLYALFDNYIFTVDENTASDVEVALDPELLGRVFENLLASINPETKESARKATGSYYTPREIVDYMVSSSLKEYLKTKTTIDETKLESLCFNKICDFEPMEKTQILQAIFELKVLDPACGSGAFPMGLLNHLVAMLDAIDFKEDEWFSLQSKEFKEKHKNRDKNYIRKLSIIQNSIFGVDIQPIAIEISKLRFFLSLIVDESNDKIEPLPNMEFKFVCANTLLPLQKKGQMSLITSDYTHIEKELKRIKEAYFNTTDRDEKERLKKSFLDNLKALRHEIGLDFDNKLDTYNPFDVTSSAEFFDSDYMFGISEGFDIVIGNPPYIDSENMSISQSQIREKISSIYSLTKGNWDIYIAFFEAAFNFLSKKGCFIYITPDKWISKPFGDALRISKIKNLASIVNCGRDIFEEANVDSIITLFSYKNVDYVDCCIFEQKEFKRIDTIDKKYLQKPFALDILFSKYMQIIFNIETCPKLLSQFASCKGACATSDAYKIKDFIQNGTEELKENSKYFKIINTGTVGKYVSRWSEKEMRYLKDKYLFPVLLRDVFLSNFTNSYGIETKIPKIIIKGLTLLDACIDERGDFVAGKSTLVISSENKNILKFLLSIINSKLMFFYVSQKYSSSSYNGGINFTKDMINNFPMPNISAEGQQSFIDLVDKILTYKAQNSKADTSELEAQIDKMVYELYNLTSEEIAIIEGEQ